MVPLVFSTTTIPASLVTIPIIRDVYRFDNQPSVALWNLQRLAQTLTPFIEIDALNRALDRYQDALLTHYGQRMRQKLGFFTEQKSDNVLLNELFSLMAREGSDYTRTFRMLSHTEQQSASSPVAGYVYRSRGVRCLVRPLPGAIAHRGGG